MLLRVSHLVRDECKCASVKSATHTYKPSIPLSTSSRVVSELIILLPTIHAQFQFVFLSYLGLVSPPPSHLRLLVFIFSLLLSTYTRHSTQGRGGGGGGKALRRAWKEVKAYTEKAQALT